MQLMNRGFLQRVRTRTEKMSAFYQTVRQEAEELTILSADGLATGPLAEHI